MKNIYKIGLIFILLITTTTINAQNKHYALFLYQFTKYVEWPEAHTKFKMSVIGNDEIYNSLKEGLVKRGIEVSHQTSLNGCYGSQIIFISSEKSEMLVEAESFAASNNILLVTDAKKGASSGATIGLVPQGDKIRFEYNKRKAAAAGLKASTNLTSLAILVN